MLLGGHESRGTLLGPRFRKVPPPLIPNAPSNITKLRPVSSASEPHPWSCGPERAHRAQTGVPEVRGDWPWESRRDALMLAAVVGLPSRVA